MIHQTMPVKTVQRPYWLDRGYGVPIRLVSNLCDRMYDCGILIDKLMERLIFNLIMDCEETLSEKIEVYIKGAMD